MFKTINYRKTRALQISLVFATALLIQNVMGYSHAGWIGFAVMMIYAGFDKDASLQRTIQRFLGALLGLLLSFILWVIGQIDYRFVLIIVPFAIFMAFFSLGKSYTFPTVFTVSLTALGTYCYAGNEYAVPNFFFDYLLSTVTALLICMLFENYIFYNDHLAAKFFLDLQKTVVIHLNVLFHVVTAKPLHQSSYLKKSADFNLTLLALSNFVNTTKQQSKKAFLDELIFFNTAVHQAYHNIQRLFVLAPLKNTLLELETQTILLQLAEINQYQRIKSIGE